MGAEQEKTKPKLKGGLPNGALKLAFSILECGDHLGVGYGIFSEECVVSLTASLGSSVLICKVRRLDQQQFPNLFSSSEISCFMGWEGDTESLIWATLQTRPTPKPLENFRVPQHSALAGFWAPTCSKP